MTTPSTSNEANNLPQPPEKMDLLFQLPESCPQISSDTLNTLQQITWMWKPMIEEFVRETAQGDVGVLLEMVHINGKPVAQYFKSADFLKFVNVLKEVVDVVPDAPALLQEVIGIVCLAGVVCQDFSDLLLTDNAEKSWQELAKNANLLVQQAKDTFARHEETFQRLFDAICLMLPGNYAFFIRLSATLIANIWQHHHSIADWIAANWEAIVMGVRLAGAAIAVGAAVYGAYKMFTANRKPCKGKTKHDKKSNSQ